MVNVLNKFIPMPSIDRNAWLNLQKHAALLASSVSFDESGPLNMLWSLPTVTCHCQGIRAGEEGAGGVGSGPALSLGRAGTERDQNTPLGGTV